MRYWKGSIALSPTQDYPLLRQVLRSTFVTHRQLYDFMRLEYCTSSRHSFNNRVLRLVKHNYLVRDDVPFRTDGYVYSISEMGASEVIGFATVVSLALQHGVPLDLLCAKLSHTRFEPSGWSGNQKIGYATSLMDYLFRWLELRFLKTEQGQLFELLPASIAAIPPSNGKGTVEALGEFVQLGDGPACIICGSLMVRSGSCHRCMTCGSTSGCS